MDACLESVLLSLDVRDLMVARTVCRSWAEKIDSPVFRRRYVKKNHPDVRADTDARVDEELAVVGGLPSFACWSVDVPWEVGGIYAATVSPDGRYFAYCTRTGIVEVRNVPSGSLFNRFDAKEDHYVDHHHFFPHLRFNGSASKLLYSGLTFDGKALLMCFDGSRWSYRDFWNRNIRVCWVDDDEFLCIRWSQYGIRWEGYDPETLDSKGRDNGVSFNFPSFNVTDAEVCSGRLAIVVDNCRYFILALSGPHHELGESVSYCFTCGPLVYLHPDNVEPAAIDVASGRKLDRVPFHLRWDIPAGTVRVSAIDGKASLEIGRSDLIGYNHGHSDVLVLSDRNNRVTLFASARSLAYPPCSSRITT